MSDYEMTVEQLISILKGFKPTARVLVASDEELNTLYKGIEVCKIQTDLDATGENTIVFYGLSGLEFEDVNLEEE